MAKTSMKRKPDPRCPDPRPAKPGLDIYYLFQTFLFFIFITATLWSIANVFNFDATTSDPNMYAMINNGIAPVRMAAYSFMLWFLMRAVRKPRKTPFMAWMDRIGMVLMATLIFGLAIWFAWFPESFDAFFSRFGLPW